MVAIRFQTTNVSPEKTAREISQKVRDYGGTRFEQRWTDDGHLRGLRFDLPDEEFGPIPIQLEAKVEEVYTILDEEAGLYSSKSGQERHDLLLGKAYKVAWRNLKQLVEAMLTAFQLGLTDPVSLWTGYIEVRDPQTGENRPMSDIFKDYASRQGPDQAIVLDPTRALPEAG